jgi:tRNA(Ile)-lysidine synthase
MLRDPLPRILSTVSSFNMIADHDTVIIALSGGADSVALLAAMAELTPRYRLKLAAAHIHHGLRGAEADRDAEFAAKITQQIAGRYGLDIPFYLHKADVKKIAKEKKLSTQEAGRLVRDSYLRRIMDETGATKIATGHTGSDNAETFLMRLIAGAGPEGLSGIPPVRPPYIRPLIETTRAEVEAFLTCRGIPWIVDSSNLKNDYLRNRVRNQIMPALAAANPSAPRRLIEAVAAYRDAFAPLKAAAEDFVARHAEGGTVPAGRLSALPAAVASEVVKLLIFNAAGPRKIPVRLSRTHVRAVLGLADGPSRGTRAVKLPGGLLARRIYDTLVIVRAAARSDPDPPPRPETPLVFPGVTPLPFHGLVATARIIDGAPPAAEPAPDHSANSRGATAQGPVTALFDYDRVSRPPAVRGRRPGDRVALPAAAGTKKLSDLFIDQKVPRHERDRVPILVSGDDIMWVMGWGVDGRFTPTEKTRRLLCVTFAPAEV